MKNQKHILRTLWMVSYLVLFSTLVSAQVLRPRDRNAPVTKPSNEPPVRTNPSPELKNLVEAEGIREVKEDPGETNVVITFNARPSAPIVEISTERPIQRDGGRLDFANRMMSPATRLSDRPEVIPSYKASFSGLQPGTLYYYIISIRRSATRLGLTLAINIRLLTEPGGHSSFANESAKRYFDSHSTGRGV